MRILYVGPFNPSNGRNRSIIRGLGLAQNQVEIANSTNSSRPIRYASCAIRAVAADTDALIIGSRGDYFGQPLSPVSLFAGRKLIVFDALLSLYETLVIDRGFYSQDSTSAGFLHLLDHFAMVFPDILLSDTETHAKYYAHEFGIPVSKFRTLYIGTDDTLFYPRVKETKTQRFTIGFWGGFIPLQGVETIVEAAKLVSEESDIRIVLVGHGQTFQMVRQMKEEMNIQNLDLVVDWIPYERLPDVIKEFDVCLGIFGTGSKAQNVIPNKVYEALAMGLPVITADTEAARELLSTRINCMLTEPGNPKSLAKAILELRNDPALRQEIAKAGHDLFRRRLTPQVIGKELTKIIADSN